MQMIRAGEIEQKKYGFGLSGLEIALVQMTYPKELKELDKVRTTRL
jgi:hypothetical protein